jgi:transcriptional antiterminator RfaH
VISNSNIATKNALWIVLTTKPHCESSASENLGRQGFNFYCPMIIRRIRHARKAYDAPRPLFPGYVFVELGRNNRWRPILGTYGVRSIVRNGEVPAMLPAEFVEGLKSREIDGAIRKPENPFQPGQPVAICGGPFDGLVGQILELRENDRVLLLLDLLNQQAKVYVGADLLSPV